MCLYWRLLLTSRLDGGHTFAQVVIAGVSGLLAFFREAYNYGAGPRWPSCFALSVILAHAARHGDALAS